MTYPTGELFGAMTLGVLTALAVAWMAVRARFPVTPLDGRAGHVDGLRGFLALCVMCHHFAFWISYALLHRGWTLPDVPFLNNLGKGGVSLFFMITGLLFYPRIVVRGADQVDWLKFWTTRAFRILPLSIIVTAVVAAASACLSGGAHADGLKTLKALLVWVSGYDEPPLFGYATRKLNAGVMWSLGYEWLFYLAILPMLAGLSWALRGRAKPVAAVLIFFSAALAWRLVKPGAERPAFLMLFALGMLVAELRGRAVVRRWLSGPGAAVVGLLLVIAAMASNRPTYAPPIMGAYALLLLAVASGNSLFGVLASRPARALGDASFSLYMLHGLALSGIMPILATHAPPQPIWWLPLIAAVVAAASLASYVLIERPMIELGKRVAGWRPRRDRSLAVEAAP